MAEQQTFEFMERPTIKGFPELRWTGKRPYRSTQYFPAQLRERYGEERDGWMNRIYWGDNLQVMSHLLKEFRGKVDLIYIDPPFDSKADYKKKIKINGSNYNNELNSFEEKQYTDIWTNDQYLQFMYERIVLLRELLSEKGSLWLHCDPNRSHYLKIILDEIFGNENFINEICWKRSGAKGLTSNQFPDSHDIILYYSKNRIQHKWKKTYTEYSQDYLDKFRYIEPDTGRKYMMDNLQNPNPDRPNLTFKWNGHTRCWRWTRDRMQNAENEGIIAYAKNGMPYLKRYLDENKGQINTDTWFDISPINSQAKERVNYPTQKPEELLERILNTGSNCNDIIFDCFMGSGTTQAVAMKLGRRFIGADINLGAIHTTTKRLISLAAELQPTPEVQPQLPTTDNENVAVGAEEVIPFTGLEVYNVNNYEFFRNPIEARELLIEALEIQPFPQSDIWDGELDGRMVKIMPVNRIATKADLEELKANLPYKTYEKRKKENPNEPVEKVTIVCIGHEPDLKAALEAELSSYKFDIEIVDILRDKADLQLKRDSEADIVIEGGRLVIRAFYPLNLMQKLSLQKEFVEDWRQLVESVMIDWNYDGVVMEPSVTDVPDKRDIVKGIYDNPYAEEHWSKWHRSWDGWRSEDPGTDIFLARTELVRRGECR